MVHLGIILETLLDEIIAGIVTTCGGIHELPPSLSG
jgi:hypothetical protein